MATGVSTFPVLNNQLRTMLRYTVTDGYEFYYDRDGQEFSLIAEENGAGPLNHKIIDDDGIWVPDDYNLGIRRDFTLLNCECLYGFNGIACSNATIGLALLWTSADSRQRGAVQIGELTYNNKIQSFHLEHEFGKAQVRGKIELSTVLYIKKAGMPKPNERHLANVYGCILGVLDRYQFQVDGSGSAFPIYEVKEPSQPLWYVKCDWEDPTFDSFTETFAVYINKAHKNYCRLDNTKNTFDSQLLYEIMAGALCTLILKLKNDNAYWDNTVNGVNLQPGSVSSAVYYFINTLEWDVSSPEILAVSIRKYLDKRMK